MLRRLAPLVAVALVAVPAARADADPASDVLYTQRIYLPFFGGKVSPDRAQALKQVVDAAWNKGYKVKVALIGTNQDLGGVYQMFGQPQQYAQFLGQELVFLYKGLLVTVMPQGFGAFHYKKPVAREQAVLKKIPVPAGTDGLAEAATTAVSKLAGVKAPALAPRESTGSSSSSSNWTLIAILAGGGALVAAMLVSGILAVRKKRPA